MKKLFLLVIPVIVIGIISCNQPTPVNDALGDQNKALVDKYIQAVCTGDVQSMGDILAENYKGYGPSVKDSTDKAKSIANWTANWDGVFSSIKYSRIGVTSLTVPEGRNKGDWVLEWARIDVDYKNGTPSVNFQFHAVYRIENNKIAFSASYYNVADILEQEGYKFVPPGKGEDM